MVRASTQQARAGMRSAEAMSVKDLARKSRLSLRERIFSRGAKADGEPPRALIPVILNWYILLNDPAS
jgi:hypothetical protein